MRWRKFSKYREGGDLIEVGNVEKFVERGVEMRNELNL
jgi:hypothetical protein